MSHSAPGQGFTEVLRVLELEQADDLTFIGTSLPQLNERVYGGQVLAQAILAAARTSPLERAVHSVHGYFLRPGRLDRPITFAVERLRDGRSFSARRTHALQDGEPILSLICSFQEHQPGLEHAAVAPDVPDPEDLPSAGDLFASLDHPAARFLARTAAFDVKHVGRQLYVAPDPARSPTQALWMRARGPVPSPHTPELSSGALQAALLAYACDQVMLEPVLREHGVFWRTPDLSIASLDHAMWWHREVDVSQWLLYVQDSPAAQGGRGLGTARIYDRAGALVASVAQEGMIRLP